jgi:hypothetical protein
MTWSVYQHWDPLKVCIVGKSYPPEFYSWIQIPRIRALFEKIAIETEEDYQNIINKLTEFGVEVLRPDLPQDSFYNGKYVAPPMTPRDNIGMIGDTLYYNTKFLCSQNFSNIYNDIKDASWPPCESLSDFKYLPQWIKDECINVHRLMTSLKPQVVKTNVLNSYDSIIDIVKKQNNKVSKNVFKKYQNDVANTAMVSRLGNDLIFGTTNLTQNQTRLLTVVNNEFKTTRNHIINTGGHTDGTFCPVCPGLIISIDENYNFEDTFPGWEVVYVQPTNWDSVKAFVDLRLQNRGKWLIPGFEYDQDLINLINLTFDHWTGYIEETVFDVNLLIIDRHNVIVTNYNRQVFDALSRYNITPHIIPMRHRYFWDGGLHCVTSDLHREGVKQNILPVKNNV